jgi:hypothetical protein
MILTGAVVDILKWWGVPEKQVVLARAMRLFGDGSVPGRTGAHFIDARPVLTSMRVILLSSPQCLSSPELRSCLLIVRHCCWHKPHVSRKSSATFPQSVRKVPAVLLNPRSNILVALQHPQFSILLDGHSFTVHRRKHVFCWLIGEEAGLE